MRIGYFAVLGTIAAIGAATPASAGSQLVVDIFKHECRQANADNLAFTCAIQEGAPAFILARAATEADKYRLNLLQLRVLQSGAGGYQIVDKVAGMKRFCSPAKGAHPYAVFCNDWQKSP